MIILHNVFIRLNSYAQCTILNMGFRNKPLKNKKINYYQLYLSRVSRTIPSHNQCTSYLYNQFQNLLICPTLSSAFPKVLSRLGPITLLSAVLVFHLSVYVLQSTAILFYKMITIILFSPNVIYTTLFFLHFRKSVARNIFIFQ